MRNVKARNYTPAELEIIMLDSADIITTSEGGSHEDDPNEDMEW